MRRPGNRISGARDDRMRMEALRKEIDGMDRAIVRLLVRRARKAVTIGREKRKRGLPVVDPAREAEVLDRVCKLNAGPISGAGMKAIYRTIVKECARLQARQ